MSVGTVFPEDEDTADVNDDWWELGYDDRYDYESTPEYFDDDTYSEDGDYWSYYDEDYEEDFDDRDW